MVKSVIGGFQKISKNKKSDFDEDYENSSKKKSKIKRKASKFTNESSSHHSQDYDDEDLEN